MNKHYSNLLRKVLYKLSVTIVVGLGLATLTVAAPVNDNFLNAQLLSGVDGSYSATNVDATKQAGEPYHMGNLGGSSIWFKFVAPGNGVLHFATANTGFDTVVSVYTGASVNNLTLVGQNDNDELIGWMQIYSRVYVGTQAGQTYYIAVDGKNPLDGSGAAEGPVAGNFSFENGVPNDDFDSPITLASGNKTYSITTSNVGATKESGEPNHMDNPGGKSVWFNYVNQVNYPRSITLTLNSSRASSPAAKVSALIEVYKGNSLATLTPVFVSQHSSVGKIRLTFLADANWTYRIAIDGFDGGLGASNGTFTLTYGVTKDARTGDFDEDGKADLTVFRPTEGNWYSRDSGTNNMRAIHWGANSDRPMLAKDENGDPIYAVFRPDTGVWYQIFDYFSNNAFKWGMSGDIALMKNVHLARGTTESRPTVFRPSTGTWWFFGEPVNSIQFGQQGDVPVLADFDGDGTDEVVVFRPSTGNWHFLNLVTNQIQTVNFGLSGDIPVPADYNADGIADVAIFRPSTGDWWFRNAQTGAQSAAHFGKFGDVPQPADYDGDGRADMCVFRSGVWWILQTSTGTAKVVQWGLFNDLPVTASPYAG